MRAPHRTLFRRSGPSRHDDRRWTGAFERSEYCVRFHALLYSPRRTNRRGRGYCVSRSRREISTRQPAMLRVADTATCVAADSSSLRSRLRPLVARPSRSTAVRVRLRSAAASNRSRYQPLVVTVHTLSNGPSAAPRARSAASRTARRAWADTPSIEVRRTARVARRTAARLAGARCRTAALFAARRTQTIRAITTRRAARRGWQVARRAGVTSLDTRRVPRR